jgi:ubiquinone/menaquinone biosynthesis C-methylase UbiE
MARVARRREGLPFVVGGAESLPIRNDSVGVVTVASGVHWFEPQGFFAESARVLRPGGRLILYEHAAPRLVDDRSFVDWVKARYFTRYPTPQRGRVAGKTPPPPAIFRGIASDKWQDRVSFSNPELVAYLLTQSNVADAVDSGRTDEHAASDWLVEETQQFFVDESPRTFLFTVTAECFAKIDDVTGRNALDVR